MKSNKRLFSISALFFCVANLFLFLIFFIQNYVIEAHLEYIEYAASFIGKFVDFALPPIAAALLLFPYLKNGIRDALIKAIFLALPRIIYLFPYNYLYHTAGGYEPTKAIYLSALLTVLGVALAWAHIVILFLLIRMTAIRSIAKSLASDLPPSVSKTMPVDLRKKLNQEAKISLGTNINFTGAFDFSVPLTVGIFAAAFGEFIVNLMREIIDTVTYLVNFAGYYRIGETIYITLGFVFLIIELLTVHLIAYHLFKKINLKRKNNGLT